MPRLPALVSLLVLAAVAGVGLGLAGGGSGRALAAATGQTPQSAFTATPAGEVTTAEIETTPIETAPPETEPAPGVTTFEPETTPVETEQPGEEQPVEPTASTSDTPWGWIIFGVLLATALVGTIVAWRRGRTGSAAWSRQMADLTQRCFVLVDDVLAQGSVVTGHVHALAARAQTLETRAPDDRSRSAAGRVRAQLAELAAALETDRTLRLGSPPPSADQLSYSTAVIREQVRQLQAVLRPPGSTPT
jgi:hypothetical protein